MLYMKFRMIILRVGMIGLAIITGLCVTAEHMASADSSALGPVLSEFKVTTNDGQFFTLYNPSTIDSINLSSYELEYFNNYDVTKATSSKIIPLSGTLAPGTSYVLSDGAMAICYQLTVNAMSLGFSGTSGFVELLQQPVGSTAGTLIVPNVVDYVGWAKSTSKGVDTLSIFPSAQTLPVVTGTSVTWLRKPLGQANGQGTWQAVQPSPNDACALQTVPATGGTGVSQAVVNTPAN
jgi:hypothetical protein